MLTGPNFEQRLKWQEEIEANPRPQDRKYGSTSGDYYDLGFEAFARDFATKLS